MRAEASDIKLASVYSTIKMMHGPINIRLCCMFLSTPALDVHRPKEKYQAPGRPGV